MDYNELHRLYKRLRNYLIQKKDSIINRNIDKLPSIDEDIVVVCGQIEKFNLENKDNDFTDEQKEELKKLGVEIKELEENNEILIKHSLSVINNLLSGILNIVTKDKGSYNAKGVAQNESKIDISSIMEEA